VTPGRIGSIDSVVSRSRADEKSQQVSRTEIFVCAALFLVGVAVRIALNWYQKVDSDEPQHAHVAWAWTQGLISYRDVFDNHTPLFHLVTAPLLWLVGARPEILFWLRLSMLGLNGLTLTAVGLATARLFSLRAALYSVVCLLWFAPFLIDLGEFRTDVLWTTAWAWAVFAVIRYRSRDWGGFWVGFLLGVCLSVSLKSILFLLVLLIAWIVQRFVRIRDESAPLQKPVVPILAFLAGLLLLPTALILFFGLQGALSAMYECVVLHNLSGSSGTVSWIARISQPLVWLLLPALYFGFVVVPRRATNPKNARDLVWHVLIAGLYCPVLVLGWPVVTKQDFAPFYPLVGVYLGPLLLVLVAWIRRAGIGLAPICGLLVWWTLEAGYVVSREVRRHRDPLEFRELADVIRLTDAQDYVLDPKGESIFRRRPIYPVLELFTMAQFDHGRLGDDIPEQLVRHQVMLAWASDRYPQRTQQFLRENYLRRAGLLVGGKWLAPSKDGYKFAIAVPGDYAIVGNVQPVPGTLNGQPFSGRGFFTAGDYVFEPAQSQGNILLEWARAWEREERGASGD
jgi:hypothetical protein